MHAQSESLSTKTRISYTPRLSRFFVEWKTLALGFVRRKPKQKQQVVQKRESKGTTASNKLTALMLQDPPSDNMSTNCNGDESQSAASTSTGESESAVSTMLTPALSGTDRSSMCDDMTRPRWAYLTPAPWARLRPLWAVYAASRGEVPGRQHKSWRLSYRLSLRRSQHSSHSPSHLERGAVLGNSGSCDRGHMSGLSLGCENTRLSVAAVMLWEKGHSTPPAQHTTAQTGEATAAHNSHLQQSSANMRITPNLASPAHGPSDKTNPCSRGRVAHLCPSTTFDSESASETSEPMRSSQVQFEAQMLLSATPPPPPPPPPSSSQHSGRYPPMKPMRRSTRQSVRLSASQSHLSTQNSCLSAQHSNEHTVINSRFSGLSVSGCDTCRRPTTSFSLHCFSRSRIATLLQDLATRSIEPARERGTSCLPNNGASCVAHHSFSSVSLSSRDMHRSVYTRTRVFLSRCERRLSSIASKPRPFIAAKPKTLRGS
mmetsp:Transcript_52613/g.87358  ORF Transcript_52613/g.87358 Transcript_52613/m.87358 type:complete len:487 (+) Transcript_52613:96-1556(+)